MRFIDIVGTVQIVKYAIEAIKNKLNIFVSVKVFEADIYMDDSLSHLGNLRKAIAQIRHAK